MDSVVSDKLVTARKKYKCDASYWWNRSGYSLADCETDDQRLVVQAAEADGWKILPGQVYRKMVGSHEGRLTNFRARPGMDSVCNALGLYDE